MDIILSCTQVKLKVPPVESTALSWIKLLKGAQPVPKNTENSATNSNKILLSLKSQVCLKCLLSRANVFVSRPQVVIQVVNQCEFQYIGIRITIQPSMFQYIAIHFLLAIPIPNHYTVFHVVPIQAHSAAY